MMDSTDASSTQQPAKPAARKRSAAPRAKAAPAAKPPAASAAKAASKASPKAASPAAPSLPQPKPKKPKLVRDGFTMPKDEYARIDELKLRSAKLGRPVKKSELIRAGLNLLVQATDEALLNAIAAVPTLKTGRPKSERSA